MSRFLMHYVGGGTDFPFQLLKKSCDECGSEQPIRVVISDSDFDFNYDSHPDNAGILLTATNRSPRLILLLHRPNAERVKQYRLRGATVVEVQDMSDFPCLATELARSLFE